MSSLFIGLFAHECFIYWFILSGLSSANIVWAFHSEAEEELLSLVPCMQKDSPKWSELREFKVAWWVRNNNSLRRCIEKVENMFHSRASYGCVMSVLILERVVCTSL